MEDRLIELESLQKALQEGTGLMSSCLDAYICLVETHYTSIFSITEAYDKMQMELITAKESLTKILMSKDVKATVVLLSIHPA